MKRLVIIIALFLLLASTVSLMAAPTAVEEAVEIVNVRKDNSLVIRAEREFVGGQVEIYSASGELITSQQLTHRKIVVYFFDVKFGEYIITVTKGNKKQEFRYVKK